MEDHAPHGSRAGPAALMGAIGGFILGVTVFLITRGYHWLAIIPASAIVLAVLLRRRFVARE